MADETLYADAHLTGDFPNPSNAVGNTSTTWAGGAGGSNTNHDSRWSMDNPSGTVSGTTSSVSFLVRKTDQTTNPTAGFELWINGTVAQTFTSVAVSSTTGVEEVRTVTNSNITDASQVEFRVTSTVGGGGVSTRAHVQLARIAWTADVVAAVPAGSGSGSYSWAGTAAGEAPAGAAESERGTANFTLTAARSGTATGSYGWTGAAAGSTDRSGDAAGSHAWTGAAAGVAPEVDAASGTASGTFQWAGAASGTAPVSGAASGSYTFTGTAAGQAPSATAESERGTASFTLTAYADALAPTLLTPTDLSVSDGTGFTWQFNTSNVGATQTKFAFRATVDGVDGWWNGTGWQTSEVFITSAVESLTLPAGAWDTFPTSEIAHGSELQAADTGLAGLGVLEANLETHNGQLTTTSDGQRIEGLHIVTSTSPAVVIAHNNVTIRGCKVTHQGSANGISQNATAANALIEFCDIDGTYPSYEGNFGNIGIQLRGNGVVARRNYIYGVRDGFQVSNVGGTQILENYILDLHRHSGAHNDSIMIQRAFAESYDCLIARNHTKAGNTGAIDLIIGVPVSPTGDQLNHGLHGITVRDNLLWGNWPQADETTYPSGYACYGGHLDNSDAGREANNTNIKFINNRFIPSFGVKWYGELSDEPTNRNMNITQTGNEFTTNRWLDGYPHGDDLAARW